jgi:hypothetical protein
MACRFAPSEKRYLLRLAIFMALYVALLYPVNWAAHHGHMPTGVWLYAAAVLPALPVLGAIWAMMRFLIEEEDEYKRFLRVRSFIWATGLAIAIMTVWGFLEDLAKVPPLPPMYPFFIFLACVGVVHGLTEALRR